MTEQTQDNSYSKIRKYIFMLMAGHTATDINQGALPAALPFLVRQHSLSFSAAGGLMLALTGISSIIQPLLGYLSDRVGNPQIMSVGIILAGLGFSALGLATSYPIMFICVLICGVGIALFHPEGGRMVNCIAQTNKGTAMGTFVVGGSIGFTAGAIMIAIIVPTFGLRSLLFFMIPGLIVVALLQYNRKALKNFSQIEYDKRTDTSLERKKDNWKGFIVLAIIILLDSIANYGLITFIPLFWVNVVGQTEAVASVILGIMMGIGAVSTYLGGKLADRFGFRNMIVIGSFLYGPSILFAGLSTNLIPASIAILCIGFTINLIRSPAVALGQRYLPNHVGMATGITLGLAVSFGGIASPILGRIGDLYGLVTVILVLAAIGGLVAFLSLLIKNDKAKSTSSN